MKRILVADDSVTIQKVIALTFADEPFEVKSVGTGSEALELVKTWKPDIVLADVIMPQMNGYELCKAVKQLEEASPVPVLLLAGTFEAFDEEEAKSVGADDFITKPFESGELIEKVKTLIGDVPAAPQVETPPLTDEEAIAVEPAEVPEAAAPAEAPSPAPGSAASEPDIWDILSGSGDDAFAKEAGGGEPAPGFGPTEDAGVVDVGSFDVGIGRPESQPVFSQPASEVPVETTPEQQPDFQTPAAEPPPVEVQQQDMDEKSRVENMEKDFFGFETGAVEEVSATDFLDEAVEEVTFEIEPQPGSQEPATEEASFVVPEPAEGQAFVTGETISPETMAPEPPPSGNEADRGVMGDEIEGKPQPAAASVLDSTEIPEYSPEPPPVPEPVPGPSFGDVPPAAPTSAPPAASTPAEEVVDEGAMADMKPLEDVTRDAPPVEPLTVADMPGDLESQPEPPLELPVDFAPEFNEEFSPEPAKEPVVETPLEVPSEPTAGIPDASVTEAPADAEIPASAAEGALGEEDIKKIVEQKVEKIVWEVVPEMAEVIIREAIQKIKDGS